MAYRFFGRFCRASAPATIRRLLRLHHPVSGIARGLKSHIHRKSKRGKPLTAQARGSNRTKSRERVRVEHVFDSQANDMGGTLVRTIGLARARAKIGLKNLTYNMRRLNPNPA